MLNGTQDQVGILVRRDEDHAQNGRATAEGWLGALGIKDGDWFKDSKWRFKRGMKCRALGEAGRVWCCLGLHTAGYSQELAVKSIAKLKVELSPSDISALTGIKRANVTRALRQLAAWGLCEITGTTKGQIRIYVRMIPPDLDEEAVKDVEAEDRIVIARDNNLGCSPDDVATLNRIFKSFKIKSNPGIVITRDTLLPVLEVARNYEKARMVLARALDGFRAGEPNTKERNQSKSKESSSSSSEASVTPEETTTTPPPEPSPESPAPTTIEAPERLSVEGPEPAEPRRPVPVERLAKELNEITANVDVILDNAIVERMRSEILEKRPSATDNEIRTAVWHKCKEFRETGRPANAGLLKTSVVNMAVGSGWSRIADLAAKRNAERRDLIRLCERTLADSRAPDYERDDARRALNEIDLLE